MRAILRGRVLFALGVVALLGSDAARAENLDEGKSGRRLFADSCAACHHGTRGLAKGRFRLTLFLFLQKHYASNSGSAWELASYLEPIDEGARNRSRTGMSKRASSDAVKAGSSLRPPASIPSR